MSTPLISYPVGYNKQEQNSTGTSVNSSLPPLLHSSLPPHNVVGEYKSNSPAITGYTEVNIANGCALPPLLLQIDNHSIQIPCKVKTALSRYVSKETLRSIDEDVDVAIELCLLMLSNFTDTFFRIQRIGFDANDKEKEGWKSLSSVLLREQFSYDQFVYKKILSCLEEGTYAKGPIIECDQHSVRGSKCYSYRLSKVYRCKGVSTYQLKTSKTIRIFRKGKGLLLQKGSNNPICNNLLEFYQHIEIPTLEKIDSAVEKLLAEKHKTKKQKILTWKGHKAKSSWKNPEERSFVEDGIKIYNYLTSTGLKIPRAGGDRSGGRVVDSLTLMPSWIRNLITIDGKQLVELDYTCLHPNIAMSLYGGRVKFLSHQMVADELKMDLQIVKTEHLSFFNKRWEDMKKSPLYGYYKDREPAVLANLQEEKTLSQNRYRTTSMRMFNKEVEIMTEVIEVLNGQGIYVGYVYDAVLCQKRHEETVRTVMNEVVLERGVFTSC